jgi:hypothetical protein
MQITDETQPYDDVEEFPEGDVDEALSFAQDCLCSAASLSNGLSEAGDNPEAIKILALAAESLIERFSLRSVALEDFPPAPPPPKTEEAKDKSGDQTDQQRSKISKVIAYLYALAKNTFQYFFDFLRNQKATARKIVPITKDLIGRIDAFGGGTIGTKITDRGVVMGLHIDGMPPRRATAMFEELAGQLRKINQTAGINEISAVLLAAKEKNEELFKKRSGELHDHLEKGMQTFMNRVDNPKMFPVFRNEQKGKTCYATEAMFGQNYITGMISECDDKGRFFYKALVARDPEIPVRAESFPALSPDDVRQICRTSLRLSEEIIDMSRDEDLVQKLMRDASFFVTTEGGAYAVPALHNFVAVANNHYFAYLRFITRTMQLLMRWATQSVLAYEKDANGK